MTDNWTPEQRQQYKNQRRLDMYAWIDSIKESTPCADCGNTYPAICMDFDHVRDAKFKDIARMVSDNYSKASIEKEMVKCDIVCANCHRIRTHRSGRPKPWAEARRKYDNS